jgi:UDP-N-acetylmuramate dehydrogenase
MDERIRKELSVIVGEGVRFDCPMDAETTLRAGGKAAALCVVPGVPELRKLLACLREEKIPSMVIGKGSNLLVRDEGFQGVMIRLGGDLARIERSIQDRTILFAGGGVALAHLLGFCQREGAGGLEFLAGIPGTVGGALAMNAGAWGKDMASVVEQIELISGDGQVTRIERSQLEFSYRNLSIPPGRVILKAGLRVREESRENIAATVAAYLKEKKAKQPLEYPSAGSVFKNPRNDFAGRLIESAGMKGARVGGAMISEKHANFIVNTGGATAADIMRLASLAREKVREQTGIDLELEIIVVGR